MMQRIGSCALWLAVASVLGMALWVRTTSIEVIDEPLGDEAYFGTQAAHLVWGGPVAVRTGSGNLLDPITTWTQVPFYLVWKPAFWVLRVPAIVTGLLAVGLIYRAGARHLDRTTGLIAAVLVATNPECIIFARTGCEYSTVPMLSAICLAYALKPGRVGLWAWFFVSILIYGTDVFLLPILLTVYLTQSLRPIWGDRPAIRRLLDRTLLAAGFVLVTTRFLTSRQSGNFYHSAFYKPMDWVRFLDRFASFFNGVAYYDPPLPDGLLQVHRLGFLGVMLGALSFGAYRLVLRRQWDRVALVAGWVLSIIAFHMMAGSEVLCYDTMRYGAFLLVPTALVLACLLQAILPDPAEGGSPTLRRWLLAALVLGLGGAPLWSVEANWLETYRAGGESPWTFGADRIAPKQRALNAILAEIDHSRPDVRGRGPHVIIAEDWWLYRPIQYLAIPRRDVKVVSLEKVGHDATGHRWLYTQLRRGAHAVVYANPDLGHDAEPAILQAFPPEELECRAVADGKGRNYIKIYHLKTPDLRADPAPTGPRVTRWLPYQFPTEGGELRAGRLVVEGDETDCQLVFGPYIKLGAGSYRAIFFLELDGRVDPEPGPDARISIDVFQTPATFHAQATIAGAGLRALAGTIRPLVLPFRLESPAENIEFRVRVEGKPVAGRVCFGGVALVTEEVALPKTHTDKRIRYR